MKKICTVLFLILLAINAFSQSAATKKNKLPSKKEFKTQYELFLENEKLADHWSQNWTYEKPKEDVTRELKEFEANLTSSKPNYETDLLNLIVKTYLYNLDEIPFDDVVEYGNSLKKKYPKEYRTWWIMGRFYSGSNLNLIYPEYETACQMRGGVEKKDEFVLPFLWDYIYGCNMAGMKIHARQGLHYYCQYSGTQPEDYYLYSIIYSNQATSSLDGSYGMYDTWLFEQNEKGTRLYSTLLGISIPVHNDWAIQAMGYENQMSYMSLSSDPIKISETAETHVSFTVIAFTALDKAEVERIAISSMTKENGTILKKETVSIQGNIADRYIYENPNKYADARKGMKGIVLIVAVPYNEFSGLSFERPIDYSKTDSSGQTSDGMSYWAIKPNLNRLETNIYFLVTLDACNACFDEAREWMDSILDGAIFE